MTDVVDEAILASLRTRLEGQRAELRKEIEDLGADPDRDEVEFVGDAGFSDRSRRVAEGVRSRVPVGVGVGRVAHTPRVADQHEDARGERPAHPMTSFCLQSMHSCAHGSAVSRSSPIGFPHRSHVP